VNAGGHSGRRKFLSRSAEIISQKFGKGSHLSYLFAEFVLDMPLDTPKHERLQDHMKTTKLTLVQLAPFVLCCSLDILGEPFVELVMRIEQTRHNEVEECPKFLRK